ncbi:hypothetical protein NCAS_0A03090 [Naumovozyma castellii]|uniref:NAD-dependent epimerase/dehydratase domain-containing protein n=1 Tax=Naumovozyma castellii TaxID=27288 RepID=G0V5X9_NAUCA|nr:hypothetical protein NCAS_0A03090 [Naumovozyma castellii CBS 4309]CCC66867.1 hypothetical protein NCAS_0A03090 [Naumovozyma castellii CBS 4309]
MSVFISGATGFVAQHIINQLLEQNFKVIGSVRSQAKADKLLRQFNSNKNLSLEVVEDISNLAAFDEVFSKHGKEIKYVLHTSSPFFTECDDYEKDLLIPALNGTKGILNSILKYAADNVERVVITSSIAAMFDFTRDLDPSYFYDENSWNPDSYQEALTDGGHAYNGSKKFAERYAWNFVQEHKNEIKFKLTTVNPCYVFGPQLFDENVTAKLNTSCELINKLLHLSAGDAVDNFFVGNFVDVRDVAKAHLLGFENQNLVDKRLLLISSRFNAQDILDIMNEDFKTLEGQLPAGVPHTGALHQWKGAIADNSKTKELLGFEFIPLKKTIDDMVTQILRKEKRL